MIPMDERKRIAKYSKADCPCGACWKHLPLTLEEWVKERRPNGDIERPEG